MIEEIIQTNVLLGYRHRERENRRAVLFVHGFLGDWRTTWRANGADASFQELIACDERFADFDVFSFSYKTGYLSGAAIEDVAVQLHNAISSSLSRYQLVLVAHSMGGLICMRYILHRLEHNEKPPVAGMLMYGTPTTGTELVKVAKIVSRGIGAGMPWLGQVLSLFLKGNPQLGQLASASTFLQQLHDGWVARIANGGDPDHNAARAWIPVRVVTGVDDWVVPKHSAKSVYGEIDWHPLNYDHIALVKPTSVNDIRYTLAADFLRKCRYIKEQEVLAQLRALSDFVWKQREWTMARKWDLDMELTSSSADIDASLLAAGYTGCHARKCHCRLVMHNRPILVGIALDEIEGSRILERRPNYVHHLVPSSVSDQERIRCGRAFDSILDTYTDDLSKAWKIFFPELSVRIRARSDIAWSLNPGDAERVGRGLLRKFADRHGFWGATTSMLT
jgi:pimeloyl-ACP methyl ester carboxylesterase